MDWIYLSPHLDDVALSLGGLLWEQTHAGEQVSVWTLCAGDPPSGELSPFAESLHRRWNVGREAIAERRAEDVESCKQLGASTRHFDIPDCIYRRSMRSGQPLYDSEERLWVPIHPDENDLVDDITTRLLKSLPEDAKVICPLSVGNHVDHRLTRSAAEKMGIPLYYYAEYPYAADTDVMPFVENLQSTIFSISSDGMNAWMKSVAAHQSQISTFWDDLDQMNAEIRKFYVRMGGIVLWEKT